jgi:Protein of unknown function (DUF2752)
MTDLSRARGLWAGTGILGILIAGSLAVWQPADDPAVSWCVFYRITHIPCPGCGLTRATAALLHGAWVSSFHYHPLAIPTLAQAAGLWLVAGIRIWTQEGLSRGLNVNRFIAPLALGNLAALVVVWLVRAAMGTLPL